MLNMFTMSALKTLFMLLQRDEKAEKAVCYKKEVSIYKKNKTRK